MMSVRIIGVTIAAVCIAIAATAPVKVQAQQNPTSEPPPATGDKMPTPRQRKMQDCAVKWKAEKTENNVSGREAYRAFMKQCLKS